MTKNIGLVLVFISALLTGCSPKFRYLTPQEAKEYPVVMIANCDIDFGKLKIIKGTIFIVKEVGGYKYKIGSEDMYRSIALMAGKRHKLPDNALFIKLQEKYKWGYIVYPNGQFVYDNYYSFGFNDFGKLWTLEDQKCNYNEEPPFILKENR